MIFDFNKEVIKLRWYLVILSVISGFSCAANADTQDALREAKRVPGIIKQAKEDLGFSIKTGDLAGFKRHVIAPLDSAERALSRKCDPIYDANEERYHNCLSCEYAVRYFRDYANTFTRSEDVELLKFRKSLEISYNKELQGCMRFR